MAIFDNLLKGLGKAVEFSAVEGVKTVQVARESLNPKTILRNAQVKVYKDQMIEKILREKGLKGSNSVKNSAIAQARAEAEEFRKQLEEELRIAEEEVGV